MPWCRWLSFSQRSDRATKVEEIRKDSMLMRLGARDCEAIAYVLNVNMKAVRVSSGADWEKDVLTECDPKGRKARRLKVQVSLL